VRQRLVSNGSDGMFHPTGSVTLDLPDDGIFNFTSIDIPSGVTVRFNKNILNTSVTLLATDTVNISGVIDISAGSVNLSDTSGRRPPAAQDPVAAAAAAS
jgi:hypothetical protein